MTVTKRSRMNRIRKEFKAVVYDLICECDPQERLDTVEVEAYASQFVDGKFAELKNSVSQFFVEKCLDGGQ